VLKVDFRGDWGAAARELDGFSPRRLRATIVTALTRTFRGRSSAPLLSKKRGCRHGVPAGSRRHELSTRHTISPYKESLDMSDDTIARLQAEALKAREFTHTIGERCYTLRVPTRREVRECVYARGMLRSGSSAMLLPLLRHYLLLQAVVAWTGVRERDAAPGASAAPLPWSPPAVAMVLDAMPDEADALGVVLLERADQREESAEMQQRDASHDARLTPTLPATLAATQP
jgi:hypothetical protein